MFYQIIGDGANAFIIIIAILVGFLNALAYVDYRKVKKEEGEH